MNLRPEDSIGLYTDHDEQDYQKYLELLAEKKKEKSAEGKYLRPWDFEVVPGLFQQSEPATDELKFDYIKEDFGVVGTWKLLIEKVESLNKQAARNVDYKVLFLARHGQGWHNFAIIKYGQEAWDNHWSHLNGDGEITWGPDPLLTPLGNQQAKDNSQAWSKQLANGAPRPTAFYSSPFTRSCETLVGTWKDVHQYHALIKEDVRETIGVHTCDKRSPKSVIKKRFKHLGFSFEPGFAEEDVYFQDDYREKVYEQSLRMNNFLNYLFEQDLDSEHKHAYVSVTSHSGTIRSFIMALDHRKFAIGTGGMIPIVVKATRRTDDL